MKEKYEPIEGWKWWQEAWYDTQGAKVEFFIVGMAGIIVSLIVGRLPLLKGLASHALLPFLLWGTFEFSRQFRATKKKNFETLLIPFKNKELALKLAPLSAAGLVFGLGYLLCNWLADRSLWFGALRFAVALLEASAFLFAVPLVATSEEEPIPALKKSLETVSRNSGVFLVFYALLILSTLLGLATLGAGFLFLLPLYTYFPYFLYTRFHTKTLEAGHLN